MKRIGILALQGAFAEHQKMVEELGGECFEIRQKANLTSCTMDGLIIPGGESTVMGKLLAEMNMMELLQKKIKEGLPVFGTCAGLILLAKNIMNQNNSYLAAMDISVKRNAYGRQLGSFQISEEFSGIGMVPMTFIRAPLIEKTMEDTQILARVDNKVVAARQKNMLVTAFHPELAGDLRVHEYFMKMI